MSFSRTHNGFRLSDVKYNRFEKVYYELVEILNKLGFKRISEGKAFNSGYEGFYLHADTFKIMVIEQSGVVGLEDHSVGYLQLKLFTENEEPVEKMLIKHKDRRFGDVSLNEQELEEGYKLLKEEIERQFKYFNI